MPAAQIKLPDMSRIPKKVERAYEEWRNRRRGGHTDALLLRQLYELLNSRDHWRREADRLQRELENAKQAIDLARKDGYASGKRAIDADAFGEWQRRLAEFNGLFGSPEDYKRRQAELIEGEQRLKRLVEWDAWLRDTGAKPVVRVPAKMRPEANASADKAA